MREWTTTTKKIICDEFDHSYHFQDDVIIATGPADTNVSSSLKNMFDSLPAFCSVSFGTLDKLMCYMLSEPEDMKNEDVLKWWHEHRHVYPHLYRMGLDYHTVPCKLCSLSFSDF